MTTPVRPEPTGRVLTGDEWEAAQYAPHRLTSDPKKPLPAGRVLTGDEWEQAQRAGSFRSLTFPAMPKFAADATKRINPNAGAPDKSVPEQMGQGVRSLAENLDVAARLTPQGGGALQLGAILGRQVVAPAVEHPLMTAAMMNPVGAVAGGMMAAHTVAKYGWQVAHESQMTPEERAEALKDPNRVSGEAAAVQAVMLGLGGLAGVKALRSVSDFGGGVVEAGARGIREADFGFAPEVGDAAQASNLKASITRHAEGVRLDDAMRVEVGRQNTAVREAAAAKKAAVAAEDVRQEEVTRKAALRALTGKQRRPGGVALTPEQRLAYDAAQLTGEEAPRYFETEKGAEVLGTMAGKHGLPETASPYPPETPQDVAWKQGHATSTEKHPEGFTMGGALTENRIPEFTPQRLPTREVDPGEQLPFGPVAPGEPGYRGPTSLYGRLSTDALATEYRALLEKRTAEEPGAQAPLWDAAREARAVEQIENRRRPDGSLSPADKKRLDYLQAAQGEEYGVGRHTFETAAAERRLTEINKHITAIEKEIGNRGKNPTDFMQAPSQGGGGLTPIEGTGETVQRGLSRSTTKGLADTRRAIEDDLSSTLGDLPEYRRLNMKDQATKAMDFLERDPEAARRVALGDEAAPEGLQPEAVFVAMRNQARREGDVATLLDLAHGGLTEQATTMGQRIRILGERDPEDPVYAMQSVMDKRSGGKGAEKAIASTVKEIEQAGLANLDSLLDFFESVKC